MKTGIAAQKQSLRAKGEDTWGKFARNAERGQKVATGVGKILKKASTLGGPIPGPLSNKGLYIPVKQKGMYFDPEGTRALTLPGGNQEQANGGLRGASTPHLGMLRQAGAPPMRKPQMPRPQSLSFQSHKVGSTYDLSLLRGLTLPKGTSKIEKIAIGEVQIHQGSFKDVLAGLKIAGYSQGQSISALSSLQKKGVLVKGADNSLELTGGQR